MEYIFENMKKKSEKKYGKSVGKVWENCTMYNVLCTVN